MNLNRKKHKSNCDPEKESDTKTEIDFPIRLSDLIGDFFIGTRRILVTGEIDEVLSTHICSCLQLFSLEPRPIYLYIHSSGGCLDSGYAIIDQMLACKCPIYTIVRGRAYSMGAMIAAFGNIGRRYATSNSSLMLHSMIFSSTSDTIEHHDEMSTHIKGDYRKKVSGLAKRLKLSAKELLELMNRTKWMMPKEAVKIGLIDGIWTPGMEQSVNRDCNQ